MVCSGYRPPVTSSAQACGHNWLPNVSSASARLRAFSIRLSGLLHPNRPHSTKNREVGRCGLIALAHVTLGELVLEKPRFRNREALLRPVARSDDKCLRLPKGTTSRPGACPREGKSAAPMQLPS